MRKHFLIIMILSLSRKIFGDTHNDVALSLGNIGLALNTLGKYEDALFSQIEALEIRQKIYGEDHPIVALSLNNVGASMKSLGYWRNEAIGGQQFPCF